MISELLRQNFKRIKRSPEFQKRVITNIIFGVLISLSILDFLFIAFNLAKILRAVTNGSPVPLMNEIIFAWFPVDYIIRLIFQRYRTATVKPYLILNVGREKIADLILLKTGLNFLNLLPFLFFIPFAATEIAGTYSAIQAAAWFLTIVFAELLNTYLVNYSKMRFRTDPLITVIVNGAVLILVFSSALLLPVYPHLWSNLMRTIIYYPYLCLTPLTMAILMYHVNYKYLISNLFLDDISDSGNKGGSREKELKEKFSFLSSFGRIGQFILLDTKLLLRNRRCKPILFTSFLMVFYGFILFHDSGKGLNDIMVLFACTFMIAIFTLTFGLLVFGWESTYFSFLMTSKINMKTYILSKYYFMIAVSTILFILTSFYSLFYGARIIFIQAAVYLFSIGVTPFIMLTFALFNKIRYELNERVYSQQGKGLAQYLGSFAVFLTQIGLYFLIKTISNAQAAIIFLGAIGLIGFVLHKQIISLIEDGFYNRKYVMISGFKK